MLRWLIAVLLVADLAALAAVRGAFGPPPAAGPLEPGVRAREIHPDALRIAPLAPSDAIVGAPIAAPAVAAAPLAASAAP